MKWQSALAALLVCARSANAIEPKNATYYCTNEASGGVKYNPQLQKWTSAQFKSDKPFVLRLQFLNSRREKQFSWTELTTVNSFAVTIAEAGSNEARPCKAVKDYQRPVEIWGDDWLRCNVSLSEFRFNPANNRYLSAYIVGYVGGDNGGDTPSVSIGTCTKID
ncbi:hypothetical protein [Bradyrhizobium glycinis]|uniref:hypothetical protein n=1 Tax=Bradyrhizobium glycinis TaxID=2751812 RepID=UPI0018D6AC9C|nr:hypothetical protein [Bradyrhizobium glycinis]MBH5372809.1 hypothetical protein [Bradyrhizobium glycinis]